MKKILVLGWVIAALFIVQPALAADIYALGAKAAGLSDKEIDALYSRQIEGQLVTGRGEVGRVTATSGEGLDGKYEVIIICSPEVRIKLQTNGFWVDRFKVKKGAVVSFTGQCNQIHKSLSYVYAVVRATIR